MTDIAKYIKIFKADPVDDYVTKRIKAIKAINVAFFKKKAIDDIISIANDIASSSTNPANLGNEVKEIVTKALANESSSFVAETEELQICVSALVAALQYINDNVKQTGSTLTIANVFSIALWSGLSFTDTAATMPKIEHLKQDIISVAKINVFSSALTSRERIAVQDLPKELKAPDGTTMQALADSIKKVFSNTISPMRKNASLDREEIDILWWLLHGFSNISNTKFTTMNDVQRIIIAGFEITTLLRKLPSHVHRQLALGDVDSTQSFSSAQLLEQLGDTVDLLKPIFQDKDLIKNNPNIFPLATLILNGVPEGNGYEVSRDLNEWCGRAVVEGSLVNMANFLSETL